MEQNVEKYKYISLVLNLSDFLDLRKKYRNVVAVDLVNEVYCSPQFTNFCIIICRVPLDILHAYSVLTKIMLIKVFHMHLCPDIIRKNLDDMWLVFWYVHKDLSNYQRNWPFSNRMSYVIVSILVMKHYINNWSFTDVDWGIWFWLEVLQGANDRICKTWNRLSWVWGTMHFDLWLIYHNKACESLIWIVRPFT